jgi:hypothetical protein
MSETSGGVKRGGLFPMAALGIERAGNAAEITLLSLFPAFGQNQEIVRKASEPFVETGCIFPSTLLPEPKVESPRR